MKKIIIAVALALFSASAFAQRGAVQSHSYIGGTKATVSGLNSTNYLNGIIPAATITVYLTGTTTKASIYSDAGGTVLSNPFTSNIASSVDPGGWIFFAATNQGLDIVMSGGNGNPSCNTAPLCYVNPVTLVDVFPTQSFSPVSGLASATSTLPIQVNGGTGPVTSGNVNVSCANNCAAYGQLLMQINPPAPAAQQYILYPTSVTGTGTTSNTVQCGGLTTGAASCSGSGTLANGGYISHPYCNLSCSTNNIITWSFPSLPSFINPANVTSIYGGMVGYTTTTTLVGNGTTFQFECGKTSQTTVATTQAYGAPLAFGTYTALLSGLVGTDVPSITCDAQMLATDPVQAGIFGNMPSTFLVINYTGSAPPTNTAITVIPPLNFNPGTNSLSLAVPFDVGIDTGAANAYAVSLPWTAQRAGTTVKFLPAHLSTSTTPTFSFNGITGTIVGPQGGALQSNDLNTTATAIVVLDNAGNWRLQDPQVSGSSANTISVNGVVVSSPNLNDTTPAAGTNGKNVAWQHSGSSVSAEIVGNGNASTYLDGTGNYSTPAGGGSVTWPASTDVVISNGTNSPAGVAPVNGSCLVGSAGAWTSGSCSGGGSGVQYNPSTAIVGYTGSSTNEDDGRVTSSPVPVGAWSCNGTTCTVNTTGTNPLTTSDWVDMSNVTGWFATPANFDPQDTGVGTFKITAATTGSFTFAYTTNTGSNTGGNAYSATYWGAYQTEAMPYIHGHGQFLWRFGTCAQNANSVIFNARFGGLSGSPKILFIQGCQNDLQAGATDVTVEGYLQSIWANAHAQGYIVFQSTMLPTSLGVSPAPNFYTYMMNINNWMYSQVKTYANTTSTQYIDHIVDMGTFIAMMANTSTIPGNSATGGYYLAERWNRALAMQNAGDITGPPPFIFSNGGLSSTGTHGLMFWQGTTDNNLWYFLNRDQSVNWYLNGDLHQSTFYTRDVNNPFTIEDDDTNGIYNMFRLNAPNIVSGTTNYRQVSACWTQIAGATWWNCATNGGTSATNSLTIGANAIPPNIFSGWPTSGIMLFANGAVRLPGVVASSGTQPLQVDTSGNLSIGTGLTNPMTTLGDTMYGGASGVVTRLAGPATAAGHQYLFGELGGATTPAWFDLGASIGSYVTGTAPIVVTQNANGAAVSCPTCGVATGTAVNNNGGATLGTSQQDGTLPYICKDTSGSGTAQTCSTATAAAIASGNCFVYTTTTANSGASLTINPNSLGATPVAIPGGSGWTTALTTNIIPANKPLTLCYDGTNLNVQQTGTTTVTAAPFNWVVDPAYGPLSTSTTFGSLYLSCSNTSGNLSQVTPQTATAGHAGVYQISGLSGTNFHSECFTGNKAATTILGSGVGTFNVAAETYAFPTANGTEFFGIDTGFTGPNPTNGAGFACDANTYPGNNNWHFGTYTGATDTGISCNQTWHQLQLSANGLTLTGYIDGTSVGTFTLTAGNYGAFASGWCHSTTGATNCVLWLDWIAEQETIGSTLH